MSERTAAGPAPRRALIVVEPRFADEHVGVRRVIVNYWERLIRLGFDVQLAIVEHGRLCLVSDEATAASRAAISRRSSGMTSPAWASWQPVTPEPTSGPLARRIARLAGPKTPPPAHSDSLDLRTELVGWVRTADYDVSMLSNPWLCDQPMPADRFTHGIVYDLVPNLLVAQAMDFGTPNWAATGFASAHHRGYEFYLDRVSTILCISGSTRDDFLDYYEPDRGTAVIVDIPFDVDRFRAEYEHVAPVPAPDAQSSAARILLVNVLDPRKNIEEVTRALAEVSATRRVMIDIVGNNRLPPNLTPQAYFKRMSTNGAHVSWYRGASDELLVALYRSCDLLLFPSLYEGLGLPVLEAQSFGVPAISGTGSSLGEINFNPGLAVDPRKAADIARSVTAFLEKTTAVVAGRPLIDTTRAFLLEHQGFEASLPARETA